MSAPLPTASARSPSSSTLMMMALAGAERIFGILDLPPEEDQGQVTLEQNGRRLPLAYAGRRPWCLCGAMYASDDVDFAYVPEKPVLRDLSAVRQARPEDRLRRLHRRGQDHHHQPHQPVLRHPGRLRSPTTASTCATSARTTCAAPWASCCRTPTCSPAR